MNAVPVPACRPMWQMLSFCLLVAMVSLGCGGRSKSSSSYSYLPLKDGSRYVYKATFNGRTDVATLLVKSFEKGGMAGYYFINEDHVAKENPLIGPTLFGLGAYKNENDSLMTIEATWGLSLTSMNPNDWRVRGEAPLRAQVLLSYPLKPGGTRTVSTEDGRELVKYTCEGYETVTVPGGEFPESVRIQVEWTFTESQTVQRGLVWLSPGVGMTKYQRATGRVEELVNFKIPE